MKQRQNTPEINEIKEISLRNILQKITKQKVLEVEHNRNKNFTGQTQQQNIHDQKKIIEL